MFIAAEIWTDEDQNEELLFPGSDGYQEKAAQYATEGMWAINPHHSGAFQGSYGGVPLPALTFQNLERVWGALKEEDETLGYDWAAVCPDVPHHRRHEVARSMFSLMSRVCEIRGKGWELRGTALVPGSGKTKDGGPSPYTQDTAISSEMASIEAILALEWNVQNIGVK